MISFKNTIQMLTITPVWGNSKYNFDCNGVACMSQKEQEEIFIRIKGDTPHF